MSRPFRLILISVVALTSAAVAQVTTTSIIGKVTDPSGAVIPGATVTATDVDRNQSKVETTNQAGEYRIDFLQTGNYSVTVSANGFKTYLQKGLQLNAGLPVTLDVTMTTGAVSEEVTVTGGAPLVNTVNAEIGTTVDKTQMVELPLVNRNAYTLLSLTPGVQTNNATTSFGGPAQVTYINGGSDQGGGSVNYYLDGAPNTTGLRSTGNILPNPDALEEFRLQTSNYEAPYGRFASGIINANVKNGANQVHGALFDFFRNTALNARPWLSAAPTPKQPLHRNQFGAVIGGPIVRDKTFFFGSYAGLRQTTGNLESSSELPTSLEYTNGTTNADFLGSPSGKSVKTTSQFTPCAANTVCASQFNPVSVALLAAWLPTTDVVDTQSGNQTNCNPLVVASPVCIPSYHGFFNAPDNTDDFLIKINQRFSERHQLSVTYFNTSGFTTAAGGGSNVPYSTQESYWRQQNSVVGDTFTVTPTIVNSAYASYTRFLSNRLNVPGISLANYGSAFVPQGLPNLPNISITGYFTLGNNAEGPGYTDNFALRDLVTWAKGKHNIQYGAEAILDKSQKVADLDNWGTFTFNGGVTGNAFADFLYGYPSSAEQDAPAHVSAVTLTTSMFFQDDFRITPKLTVDLGIRWDIQTPPVDTDNRETTFVPGRQSAVRPNAPAGLLFPGDPGIARGITPVSYKHFGPRLGFAYDPFGTGKTSIRGGAGIFWASATEEVWMASGNSVPFADRYSFSNVSSATGVSLSNPYQGNPGGNPFPYTFGTVPVGSTVYPNSTHTRFPYTYQINLQVQQQITSSLALTAAYVGTLNREQYFGPDANYPSATTNYGAAAGTSGCGTAAAIVPTSSNSQCRRPYQAFGPIYELGSGQNSYYHSLQTTVTKHLANHLSIQAFEVWSRAMSSVGLETTGPSGNNVEDASNLKLDRGRTDNDIRNVATIAIVYQPDYYHGPHRLVSGLVNGWEISPLAQFGDGLPFQVADGADANLDNLSTDRAEVIGNPFIGGRTRTAWFNNVLTGPTAAFKQNPAVSGAPVDGNEPRNYLTAPGYKTVALNLARTFPIAEKVKFQFRAEATNVLNTVNWSTPNSTITSSLFGTINSAGAMRVLQFGGKILF